VDGWELRQRRRAAGLTPHQVARAAGTAESNVSAYERSAKTPNRRTLERLRAAIDAGADSPIHAAGRLTFPAAAAALRRGLAQGWSTAELLRVVRQLRSDARALERKRDRVACFAEPSTTGDRRWDVLLAGVAEDLALRGGFEVPAWTRSGTLRPAWFVTSAPSLEAYVFARSPFPLQVRGILLDPADLEAV
jgi:transcriptional regulator with XRE-family HTH domain